MERCPIEVWERIAALSSTDGGSIGSSLSLVSHTMRTIVRPYRYHSVGLTSHNSLLAFAQVLKELTHSPSIFHIFVSLASKRHNDQDLVPSFDFILSVSAATLRTLVVREPLSFDVVASSHIFPVLECLSTPQLPLLAPDSSARHRFPSLRRMHVNAGLPYQIWAALPALAPGLTHLRLSWVNENYTFVAFLRVLLDTPLPAPLHDEGRDFELNYDDINADTAFAPGSEEEALARLFAEQLPDLQHVYVQQTNFSGEGEWHEMRLLKQSVVQRALEEIARACGDGARRLHIIPAVRAEETAPGELELVYGFEEARTDWLSLIGGGEGAWRPPHE